MATGVLVLGIGKATKLLTWVSGRSKEYRATIRFGVATNTDDAEGAPCAVQGCVFLTEADVEAVLAPLRGDIMQVPTTVSAIKVGGTRAYALARAGEDVELAARPVRISRLEVLSPPRCGEYVVDEAGVQEGRSACAPRLVPVVDVDVDVECSSGTYVRALARDAGKALGVGAHLSALRRTRVGDFTLDEAFTLDELDAVVEETDAGEGAQPVLPLIPLGRAALAMFPSLPLTEAEAGAFAHGQAPRRSSDALTQWMSEVGYAAPNFAEGEAPPIAATSESGDVLGLLRIDDSRLRTILVF